MLDPSLELRPISMQVLKDFHAFSEIPDALKYEDWGPYTEIEARQKLELAIEESAHFPNAAKHWSLHLREHGTWLGGGNLFEDEGRWKIGYYLHPDFRGKGYAKALAQAICDFAWENLHISQLYASCDSENLPSLAILTSLGFEEIGLNAELEPVKGRFRDMMLFELGRH